MGMIAALLSTLKLVRVGIVSAASRHRLLAKVIQNVKKLNTSMIILSCINVNVCHVVKHLFTA